MEHIHETWAFLVKFWGRLCIMSIEARMSLSNIFILRMRSLGQNRPLSTEHHICGRGNSEPVQIIDSAQHDL